MSSADELGEARQHLEMLEKERDKLLERRRPRQTLGHPTPEKQLEVLTDEEEAYLQELIEELIPQASERVEKLERELGR